MAKCSCGFIKGFPATIVCPEGVGCGCICYDNETETGEGGATVERERCIVYCDDQNIDDIVDSDAVLTDSGITGVSVVSIRGAETIGELHIDPETHVDFFTENVSIDSFASIISKLAGAKIVAPDNMKKQLINIKYSGRVEDTCNEVGLNIISDY